MNISCINYNFQSSFYGKKKHNSAKYIIPAAILMTAPMNIGNSDAHDLFIKEPAPKEITIDNSLASSMDLNFDDRTIYKTMKNKTIVIDAGHGGKRKSGNPEPGTAFIDSKKQITVFEKDINLSVAKQIAKQLEQTGANVILTRDSDYYVELENRVLDNPADAFISIHCDFCSESKKPKGTSVYVYSPLTNDKGKTITHKPKCIEENNNLAESILSKIDVRFKEKPLTGCKKVLRLADSISVPSILIELAFLSNKEDAERIMDKDEQNKISKQIAAGTITYFVRKEDE